MNRRVLAWTRRSAKTADRRRKSGATPVCPIGDPGLITRRSQVQILPPQLPKAEALPFAWTVRLWRFWGELLPTCCPRPARTWPEWGGNKWTGAER